MESGGKDLVSWWGLDCDEAQKKKPKVEMPSETNLKKKTWPPFD